MRILLVEDDIKIARFIIKGFKQAGWAVDHAENGEDGLHLILSEPYAAAVVDIMLPLLDGLSLVRKMRESGQSTPTIILSARRSVEDRVRGLHMGSDDYLEIGRAHV